MSNSKPGHEVRDQVSWDWGRSTCGNRICEDSPPTDSLRAEVALFAFRSVTPPTCFANLQSLIASGDLTYLNWIVCSKHAGCRSTLHRPDIAESSATPHPTQIGCATARIHRTTVIRFSLSPAPLLPPTGWVGGRVYPAVKLFGMQGAPRASGEAVEPSKQDRGEGHEQAGREGNTKPPRKPIIPQFQRQCIRLQGQRSAHKTETH